MQPVRASCPRLLLAVYLLVLLDGCAIGAQRSGMGALFTTPMCIKLSKNGPLTRTIVGLWRVLSGVYSCAPFA